MRPVGKRLSAKQKWSLVSGLILLMVCLSGCQSIGFYTQAAKGQYQIWARQESIDKLLDAPNTPATLKQRFEVLSRIRDFARLELSLPVDGHYTRYADLGRPFVVWNVEAAPEFSMEPRGWWYPLVGRLEYRGYFSERAAHDYAATLRKNGWDVSVGGASAYSTLGWFKDPVLNTFIYDSDPDLAETIFHELAHQQVFAPGDKDFNEAFAMLVGREGVRRWLTQTGQTNELAGYLGAKRREDEFAGLVLRARDRLEKLYQDVRDEDGKVRRGPNYAKEGTPELRAAKHQVIEDLRGEYLRKKTAWGGNGAYDAWFSRPINNAKLNSVAAYHDLVPSFSRLLELNGNSLPRLYEAVEKLAKMSKKDRHHWLNTFAAPADERAGNQAELSRAGH